MKKMIMILLTAVMLVFSFNTLHAEGSEVMFNGEDIVSGGGSLADVVSGLAPGDEATFEVKFTNGSTEKTNWYIKNKVVKSLEDGIKASNGAYSYTLSYINPKGEETVIFDNSNVGGNKTKTDMIGLHEATNSTEEFFYVDSLEAGQSGYIRFVVGLDGESQPNSYEGTSADINVEFAVETETKVIDTGDHSKLNMYTVMFAGSLIVVAGALGYMIISRRKERAE